LRASDGEREVVVRALRDHAAAGRLDPDELDERLERAYNAQIRADLVPLVADLPAAPRVTSPAPRRRSYPELTPVILIAVMLVAIWALTGAGYFWPVWPIGAMALGAFKHRRHELIRGHELVRGHEVVRGGHEVVRGH
jgi:fatty acid desaturase